MITVKINQGTKELCLIKIESQEIYLTEEVETVRYVAEFVIDRRGAIGIHSRVFELSHKGKNNVLVLLKAAIDSLDKEALELESKSDG